MIKLYQVTENPIAFLLAGRCETNIKSNKTNLSFTYKIMSCKQENLNTPIHRYYIDIKQTNDYIYAGYLDYNFLTNQAVYIKGIKGNYPKTHVAIRALLWVLNPKNEDRLNLVTISHLGKCACCGKTLSLEQDLKTGIGVRCMRKLFKEIRCNDII